MVTRVLSAFHSPVCAICTNQVLAFYGKTPNKVHQAMLCNVFLWLRVVLAKYI